MPSTAVLWVIGVGVARAAGHVAGLAGERGGLEMRLQALLNRGLQGAGYVVSDEHIGLKAGMQRFIPNGAHQHCQMHHLCNALCRVTPPAGQQVLLAGLRDVWPTPTYAETERSGHQLIAWLRGPLPAVAIWLEETLDETLALYVLQEANTCVLPIH